MATHDTTASARNNLIYPNRILVATDLNDGEYLIPHAIAQARASGADIVLVHAILPTETMPLDAGPMPYVASARTEQEIQAALDAMASQVEAKGISCSTVARHGFAADVVQDQIKATRAARLIMASHGRGKWGQFVMGSVANQLLGSVQIPIFIVGPKSANAPQHATPKHILHPVSLSGEYRHGVEIAIALAQSYGAELTLLHVPDRDVEATLRPAEAQSWAEDLFTALVPVGRSPKNPAHIAVAFGHLVNEIRNAAARIHADWIVLGVEESFPFWPLRDSTAYRVVSVAGCPVLAVRNGPCESESMHEAQAKQAAMPAIG